MHTSNFSFFFLIIFSYPFILKKKPLFVGLQNRKHRKRLVFAAFFCQQHLGQRLIAEPPGLMNQEVQKACCYKGLKYFRKNIAKEYSNWPQNPLRGEAGKGGCVVLAWVQTVLDKGSRSLILVDSCPFPLVQSWEAHLKPSENEDTEMETTAMWNCLAQSGTSFLPFVLKELLLTTRLCMSLGD